MVSYLPPRLRPPYHGRCPHRHRRRAWRVRPAGHLDARVLPPFRQPLAQSRRQRDPGARDHKHPAWGRRGGIDSLQTRTRRVTASSLKLPLIQPPPLRPGDRVHVVSPAGPVIPELLEEGLATLRSWELDVVVDPTVYARRPGADYLAGDDAQRATAFINAWRDPACRAIFCSRG